jgi:hypothetical protein
MLKTKLLFIPLLLLLTLATTAQPSHVDARLRAAAAQKYQVGGEWVDGQPNVIWYTIVPYKNLYFASMSGSDEYGMDFFAIWEYLDGEWHFIFKHSVSDAGPQVEAELDKLYAKHRFSSGMRKKLMHGSEKKF